MAVSSGDFVNILITTSCESNFIEKRYFKGITIADFKGKLEVVTGACPETMKLKLFDKADAHVCDLNDNSALLGSYPIDDGMRIHVEDEFTLRKQLDDEFQVDKFELSDEAYAQKKETVRAFLLQNKLGKYNEEEMKKREEEKKKEEEADMAKLATMALGDRCEIRVPGQPVRRGAVKFMGKVEFSSGLWVGVQYDEPMGKNDGSVKGKRYFDCPPKYGGFVKPAHITTGDFPEEEILSDDEL